MGSHRGFSLPEVYSRGPTSVGKLNCWMKVTHNQIMRVVSPQRVGCKRLGRRCVKVRLPRGRALVRKQLFAQAGATVKTAFPFLGPRCDRIVDRVFACLSSPRSDKICPVPDLD